MERKCSICKKSLPLTDFHVKNKSTGLRKSLCIKCSRNYSKQHYRSNKKTYKLRAKFHKKRCIEKGREYVFNFLSSSKCIDCNETDVLVLEFDHIDPSRKKKEIRTLVQSGYPILTIQKEIEKCVIRCANCHRRHTHQQINSYHYRMITS